MFILRRFLAFIPVALIVALIVFLMLHLSPGDPVAAIAGDSATAADIARIRAELGLDDPLPEQFVRWCMELIQGDLGRSYFLNRPVADLIADRVGPTLSLAGFTIVLTVLIAVPLGAWAAYRQGGWVDRALMGFSVLGFSIPSFVLGYCFVWLFGLKLNLLPSQGYVRYDESIEGWISHLILPSLTLCCIYVALLAVFFGTVAGLLSGYFRWVDAVMMRVMDGFMSIPAILFAISLIAMFGNALVIVVTAIAIPSIPRIARLVRSVVLSVREEPYVEAAIALDTPVWKILLRHILPNATAPLIVQGTYVCAEAILVEAILSFLGVGMPVEAATWGNIMAEGRSQFNAYPHMVLLPGIFLVLTILSVNILGDGLRDSLDPKFSKRSDK